MAAKIGLGSSKRALLALTFPLAVLVPLAVPFDAGQVTLLGRADAAADAATVKRAKPHKTALRKWVPTKRACTNRKIKGKRVKRCTTVRVIPPPPAATFAPPIPPPNPAALPAVPPQLNYVPPSSPPSYAAQSQSLSPIAYLWIDQADSYAGAIGTSPPDFSFDCGGVDCWAWISRAGEVLIIEPARDGVLQYFYAPRETSPYLARDSYTSFAFDGRDLVQVYDNRGRVYTGGLTGQARDAGQALQQRGRALFAASLRQRRWDRGSAAAWSAQYSSYGDNDGWNSGWGGGWRELPDWDRYARDNRYRHPPRQLDDEHRDRRDARRRYDDWHRRGDQGAPPPTGNPLALPGGGGAGAAAPPPRDPRPRPGPAPAPAPSPAPQPQPPLADPSLPVTDNAPPPPSAAEPPRRPRPRRDSAAEPDPAPAPQRNYVPPADQPMVQIQAAPLPEPVPESVPVPVPVPVTAPAYNPPPPTAAPQYVTPASTPAPPPIPAPPPPDNPPREQFRTERPNSDTDPQ